MTLFFQRVEWKGGTVMTTLFVFLTLLCLHLLPESPTPDPVIQGLIGSSVFFLVLPVLYCKMILKKPLSVLGIRRARWLPAFFWGGVMMALGGILLLFLVPIENFRLAYQLPSFVERHFLWFVAYEVIVVGSLSLLYEVFFRGLVMQFWLKSLGVRAILLQSILFAGFVWISDGFSWQYALPVYASFFSGVVAYFSRSILASWAVNWVFFFFADTVFLILH